MKLFVLFFILLLPAMGALGFDLWLAYGETMDFSKPLELSSVGWLWVKYAEENYNMMRQSIDPESWSAFISPVLNQKLVTIAVLPALIAVPILVIMKLFGLGGYEGAGLLNGVGRAKSGSKKGFASTADLGDKPKKQMKYNRR